MSGVSIDHHPSIAQTQVKERPQQLGPNSTVDCHPSRLAPRWRWGPVPVVRENGPAFVATGVRM